MAERQTVNNVGGWPYTVHVVYDEAGTCKEMEFRSEDFHQHLRTGPRRRCGVPDAVPGARAAGGAVHGGPGHGPDHLPAARCGAVVRRWVVTAAGLLYLGTTVAANWAVTEYGAVPVGFGLIAPAGVLFAGLAFTLRDLVHEAGGRWWVLAAIAAGTGLSFTVAEPRFAVASAVAFGVSELVDWAVYSPLRRRRWLAAVAASNVVGLVVDSVLFLWLAFGSLAFLPGQVVGKAYMTAAAVAVLAAGRRVWRRAEA